MTATRLVTMDVALAALEASRVVALDFETTGLDPHTCDILLWALRGEGTDVFVVQANQTPTLDEAHMFQMLSEKIVLAHNAAFEYMFLSTRLKKFILRQPLPQQFFCTQVAEAIVTAGLRGEKEEKRVALSEVTEKYCRATISKELQTSFVGVNVATFQPTDAQIEYAAQDVLYLHEIMSAQLRQLSKESLLRVARLEMAVLPRLGDMMLNGFTLNRERHLEVLREYVVREAEGRVAVAAELDKLWQRAVAEENAQRAVQFARLNAQIEGSIARVKLDKAVAKARELEAQGKVGLKAYRTEVEKASTLGQALARYAQILDKVPDYVDAEMLAILRAERNKVKPRPAETINLNSSDQVWRALAKDGIELYKEEWDEGKAEYVKKKSTDKNLVVEYLKTHDNPVLVQYAAWAKDAKVVSTYGNSLQEQVHPLTGRVHSDYNQMVNSGRLSSNRPNMQNMPPAIRACFEAAPGYTLIVADAKNQEGRLAAALSGDEILLNVFLKDWDWHSMTAAAAWPELFKDWRDVPKDSKERSRAKNANFSSIYGGTGKTLVDRNYVDDRETGDKLMAAVATATPRLAAWSGEVANQAVARGWVATVSGRKRYFKLPPMPNGKGAEWRRWMKAKGSVRRAAMNHPVQGSGADIMKQAMVLLHEPMLPLGGRLVAMVHDELVYEVPLTHAEAASTLVADKMAEAARCFVSALPIPADVHVTEVWSK